MPTSALQLGTGAAAGPSLQHEADDAAVQAAEDGSDEVRQRCPWGGMGPLQLDGRLSLLVLSICIAARPLEICPNQGGAELNKHAVAIGKAPMLRLGMTS